MSSKPRKVKAKITRTVTEIAIVYLDRQGNIEEYEEQYEELETDNFELISIHSVLSSHED